MVTKMAIESILDSVKKGVGLDPEDSSFDTDLVLHTNSALFILERLGVGHKGFKIEDRSSTWSEVTDSDALEIIKSYVILKVRLIFDPPQNSSIVKNFNDLLSEFESRIIEASESSS